MNIKFKDNPLLRLVAFTQLEYIESTGTQWIDTGISFPNGFRSVAKLYPTNVSSCKDYAGAYQQNFHNIHRIYNGSWNPCVQNNSTTCFGTVNVNTLYTVDMSNANSKYNLIVNGSILANNVSTPTGYSSLTCWLFALHRTDSTDYQYYYGRIYEVSLYDENNVLKFHGIPALDTSNVVCLYDTVSETFFYNQGTGNFIAGPVVKSRLPENIFPKITTLYHKNTPNTNGLLLLNSILNYQKTHQDEIKYDIVVNTQVWKNIIALHPEFELLAANHHKLAVYIYYSDNPTSIADELADLIADYPDLADVIAAYPDVRHSIVSTTKRANILIPNEISGYMNGIIIPYSWNQLTKVEMGIKAFVNNGVWQLLEEWVNNTVGGGRVAYGYTSGFSVSNMTTISDRTVFNDVTIEFTYNGTHPGHLFSWTDGGSSKKMCAEYVKLYDLNNNLVMHLVPYVKDNVVGFIDLINTTRFLTNTGTGTFTYILEDR